MNKRRLTVAFDVDDCLAVCMQAAMDRWNAETGSSLSPYDVTGWAGSDSGWTKYFSDEEFVLNQPVAPGAKRIVRELLRRGCDILVMTAVPLNVANARAEWLQKNFPEIKAENIIIGKRKDVCAVDILIDDAAHNILNSKARFPILMRKPWNKEVTGLMAANDFEDCLNLIDTIMRQNGFMESVVPTDVVCLIGPSGSGKHDIIKKLCEDGYTVPRIYTTNPCIRQPYYKVIAQDEFERDKDMNHFAETTSYAGFYYGIRMEEMVHLMSRRRVSNQKLVIPIDVCGANALQRIYGDCVKTVYVKRSRNALVSSILNKPISDAEKTLRIIALESETKNESLCDYSVEYTTLDEVVEIIKTI